MKYWLLTTEYPPFFGGGIGTYSATTASMMAEHGHEVSVFINDATVKNFKIETTSKFLRIIRFNPSRTESSSFLGHVTNISYEFAHIVKHFIETEGQPDIIESQEYLGIAYYLLQFKHLLYDWCRDIPVLITMHSPSFLYMEYNHVSEYRYPNFWICEMERFCLQAADLLVSPSKFMLAELRKRFHLTNPNVSVIPNPFSGKKFKPANNSKDQHNGEIVFYGKLTVQKGAFHLLKYFKQLWDDGFSRPLYLLGGHDIVYHAEGKSMGDLLRRQYKKYIDGGLLKVEGKIKPDDVADRLARAEVVIIPSANDNLPYTVFEMMALGKVVLVSKQGGQFEVIENGKDGFVFDHDEPNTFEIQLRKILGLSTAERNLIGQHAIEKVMTYYNPQAVYKRKFKEIETTISTANSARLSFPFVRSDDNQVAGVAQFAGKTGLLSIVIPFFNLGKYIGETIESLLNCDYEKTEIIIVNDGSSDKMSIGQLGQYRQRASFKVIDTGNRGLAHARNLGAEMAEGEYLTFLDADDIVDRSYYSKAINILLQYRNVQFVGGWTKYFDQSERFWPTFVPEPPLILYHNIVNSSSLVYKRSIFLQYGKNDSGMIFPGWEDYDSVVGLLSNGCNGVVLPEPVFYYRIRNDSMIRSISRSKKILLHQYIAEKHKQFYATFAAEVFGLMNANGPGINLDNPTLDYHLAEKIPFAGSLSRKLVYLVKKNKVTRRMAYKIYRLLNK